jgi:hypothetical protein
MVLRDWVRACALRCGLVARKTKGKLRRRNRLLRFETMEPKRVLAVTAYDASEEILHDNELISEV